MFLEVDNKRVSLSILSPVNYFRNIYWAKVFLVKRAEANILPNSSFSGKTLSSKR